MRLGLSISEGTEFLSQRVAFEPQPGTFRLHSTLDGSLIINNRTGGLCRTTSCMFRLDHQNEAPRGEREGEERRRRNFDDLNIETEVISTAHSRLFLARSLCFTRQLLREGEWRGGDVISTVQWYSSVLQCGVLGLS